MVSRSVDGISGQMVAGHRVSYWSGLVWHLTHQDTIDIPGFPPQRSKCINGLEEPSVIHSFLPLN